MSTPSGSAPEPATGPHDAHPPHQSFWLGAMPWPGADSSPPPAYQPSTAVQSAGMPAPLAPVVLVLVTLSGALPVYGYVARRSHEGQGSIGMLARLVSGWT